MHVLVAGLLAAVVTANNSPAVAAGVELGVGAGVGVATGQYLAYRIDGPPDTPRIDRFAPLWIDAGVLLAPPIFVGAYFQYSVGRVDPSAFPPTLCRSPVTCSSSGHTLRVGGELQYRFMQEAKLAPWVGLGIGYVSHPAQITITSPNVATNGGVVITNISPLRMSATTNGLDVNCQGGADVALRSWLRAGPYASVFAGESASVEVGIRARISL